MMENHHTPNVKIFPTFQIAITGLPEKDFLFIENSKIIEWRASDGLVHSWQEINLIDFIIK